MHARTLKWWSPVLWIVAGAMSASSASAGAPAPQEFQTARELLDALQTAGEDMQSLQAGVRYVRRMVLQGDEQTRQGELYFQWQDTPKARDGSDAVGAPHRQRVFAIRFDDLIVGRRREPDRQDWIFNGQWLIERRPDEKQYVARQLAPEGEDIDPLRLGEGPMPIPIGQKTADVLARFHTELVNPHAGLEEEASSIHEFVADTWELKLTPINPDDADNDFREIRLWYDRATLLPRLAKTIKRTGDEAFVQLVHLRVNHSIPKRVFDITRPKKSDGWDVEIKEYHGS